MYKILVGIVRELSNIKQIMAEEGKHIVNKYMQIFCKIFEYSYMNIVENEVINNDAESLGVFDGDDYSAIKNDFSDPHSFFKISEIFCGSYKRARLC